MRKRTLSFLSVCDVPSSKWKGLNLTVYMYRLFFFFLLKVHIAMAPAITQYFLCFAWGKYNEAENVMYKTLHMFLKEGIPSSPLLILCLFSKHHLFVCHLDREGHHDHLYI